MTGNEKTVGALYLGYLDRVPEAAGLSYWVGLLDDGASVGDVAHAIGQSAESLAHTPGLLDGTVDVIPDLLRDTYESLFGRSYELDALQYWHNEVHNNGLSALDLIAQIATSAQGADAEYLAARLETVGISSVVADILG